MPVAARRPGQAPAEVAVVIPTKLRPSLLRAARSVFGQDGVARIHLLIGVDRAEGDPAILDRIAAECPGHVGLSVIDPGYSTSRRHGGLYPNHYGGALRTVLGYLANSAHVAFLDDDDWYAPMHLRLLRDAMGDRAWAFSRRWLVDGGTGWPICPDEWDSVGPDRGINREVFNGFVQPSTLMMNKLLTHHVLPLWSQAAFADGSGEDRLVFAALHDKLPGGESPHATAFCALSDASLRDAHHAQEFERRGLHWVRDRALVRRVEALAVEAEAALRAAEPAEAEAACRAALAIQPRHAASLRLLARALTALGREADAALPAAQAALLDFAAQGMPGSAHP